MTKWLTRFFSYLDRFYVKRLALPRLKKVAVDCFRELVFMPCSESICDSFIGMMTRERRGVGEDLQCVSFEASWHVEEAEPCSRHCPLTQPTFHRSPSIGTRQPKPPRRRKWDLRRAW